MESATELNFGIEAAKMIGNLILVLAILFIGLYALKRWGSWMKRPGSDEWIQVLAQRPITPKHFIMVVKVQEKLLLLGVSPQGLHFLTGLDDSDSPSSTGTPE
jgi:flagellar biosynthetic protein FliO